MSQKRVSLAGGSVTGDGTDGKYRMTVENRYQVLARARQSFSSTTKQQALCALGAATFCLVSFLQIVGGKRLLESEGLLLGIYLAWGLIAMLGRLWEKANNVPMLRTYRSVQFVVAALLIGLGVVMPTISTVTRGATSSETSLFFHTQAWLVGAVLSAASALLCVNGAKQASTICTALTNKN
eukprot:TRINITY_DN2023_c0_g1_i1.p1 TRINITY_DN2023_c0_g1~~TRINITY_DN2023_c0_g1_i1.p1  ORF type:complete len:193 (-),score=33.74 TRINITY_DN2023_c0_g1_i1:21-566(-)